MGGISGDRNVTKLAIIAMLIVLFICTVYLAVVKEKKNCF